MEPAIPECIQKNFTGNGIKPMTFEPWGNFANHFAITQSIPFLKHLIMAGVQKFCSQRNFVKVFRQKIGLDGACCWIGPIHFVRTINKLDRCHDLRLYLIAPKPTLDEKNLRLLLPISYRFISFWRLETKAVPGINFMRQS